MSIELLKQSLAERAHRRDNERPTIGRAELMVDAVKKMAKAYGDESKNGASSDRVKEAIAMYRDHGVTAVSQRLRYICWGLTDRSAGPALIVDQTAFLELLTAINSAIGAKRLRANAWRGLLQGYFTVTQSELDGEARNNWSALRDLLRNTLPVLCDASSAFTPSWLATISEHENLLTRDPCSRYAQIDTLEEAIDLDDLREQLSIPAESWFWAEVLMSRVKSAVKLDDSNFLVRLAPLIAELDKQQLLATDALKLLLPRYHEISSRNPHTLLQDFAVREWGSPNKFSNAKWGQVSVPVKEMIHSWIVRDDLDDFFKVLQDDRAADVRRFQYWLKFSEQISDVRIALGKNAYHSNDPDLKSLRSRKRDRICRLERGDSKSNAIIMTIGQYVFVEFSQTGNAAYGYLDSQIAFKKTTPSVEQPDLKRGDLQCFRQIHKDNKSLFLWEHKFDGELSKLGINSQGRSEILGNRTNQRRSASKPETTVDALSMLRNKYDLEVVDMRPKKGNLWVRYLNETGDIADALRSQGFRFLPGKGYWRK